MAKEAIVIIIIAKSYVLHLISFLFEIMNIPKLDWRIDFNEISQEQMDFYKKVEISLEKEEYIDVGENRAYVVFLC